jgi:hypothetical protein
MVESMIVTLHTGADDKNRDESVRVVVRRGSELLADKTFGSGDLWGVGDQRSVQLDLRPDVPLTDVGEISVDVIKSATGSGSGGGWIFRPEITGELDNGERVILVDTNKSVKLGDGEPKDVTVSIPMR